MSAIGRHQDAGNSNPDKPEFLLGVNYWPAESAMYWWQRFDPDQVDADFALISAYGLRVIRFFLLWEDFQPQPDRVDADRLRDLRTVLDIAARHSLRAVPTLLVGNMSGVMWFPRWAFRDEPEESEALQYSGGEYIHRRLRPLFSNPGMLRAQALFAGAAARAVAGHEALHSWDLANEIDQAYSPEGPDAAWLWSWCLSQAIREASSGARVTYGAHSLSLTTRGLTIPALAPNLDYLSMHGYPIYSPVARGPLDPHFVPFVTALTAHLGGKPALMQEFGLPTVPPGQTSTTIQDDFLGVSKPQLLASEEDAAEYYRAVLERLWQSGAMGAMAWDFADYDRSLWTQPPLHRAIRERTFGLFNADKTPKPAALVVRNFAAEMNSGDLARRLGPIGGRRVTLDVDPGAYYRDPEASFAHAYAAYLDRLG